MASSRFQDFSWALFAEAPLEVPMTGPFARPALRPQTADARLNGMPTRLIDSRPRLARSAGCFVLCMALSAAAQEQDDAADARRLVEALGISAGSTVAEIGAGSGSLTVAMARTVGPGGRIYSNELDADRRAEIREAVDAAGLTNVTIVEGRPAATNVPEGCCDAVFMRNVYHHFADPAAMDASIFRSVKPGGRVAVIDFTPEQEAPTAAERSGRPNRDYHGVTPEAVSRELTGAGFDVLSTGTVMPGVFIVVARRGHR